jgi:hypothetical protein
MLPSNRSVWLEVNRVLLVQANILEESVNTDLKLGSDVARQWTIVFGS